MSEMFLQSGQQNLSISCQLQDTQIRMYINDIHMCHVSNAFTYVTSSLNMQ